MKVAWFRTALYPLLTSEHNYVGTAYIATRLLSSHAVGRVKTWSRELQQIE